MWHTPNGGVPQKESTMGDKGGKKDKSKNQKQKLIKKNEVEKKRQDKLPKRVP